ncbi:MAG: glycine betaine ABC transporter substrate-binding protein, partial [Gammaproteobacteria bacterium]
MKASRLTLLIFCLGICSGACAQPEPIAVGSKNFTEGYVLAEVMAQLLESRDIRVERKFGFGGTLVAFEALRAGEIDVYAEYTGTISQGILGADAALDGSSLNAELAPLGLETLPAFGHNNTYALTVTAQTAQRYGLRTVSDLAPLPALRFGLSHEFRDRADGWPGLKEAYGLPQDSSGIEHGLAYQAL